MRQARFTRPLTISLSQTLYDSLKDISDRELKSLAEVVRDILSEAVLPLLHSDRGQNKNRLHKEEEKDE